MTRTKSLQPCCPSPPPLNTDGLCGEAHPVMPPRLATCMGHAKTGDQCHQVVRPCRGRGGSRHHGALQWPEAWFSYVCRPTLTKGGGVVRWGDGWAGWVGESIGGPGHRHRGGPVCLSFKLEVTRPTMTAVVSATLWPSAGGASSSRATPRHMQASCYDAKVSSWSMALRGTLEVGGQHCACAASACRCCAIHSGEVHLGQVS